MGVFDPGICFTRPLVFANFLRDVYRVILVDIDQSDSKVNGSEIVMAVFLAPIPDGTIRR